jgi:hypothetical protein
MDQCGEETGIGKSMLFRQTNPVRLLALWEEARMRSSNQLVDLNAENL